MGLCVYQPALRKKSFITWTSMKPHPDLLTTAGRKALGNGIGVKLNTIEAALQTCQDMADHVVLVFVFYYYLFYIYCWCLLSTVHRQCADIRVQLAACGGPSGTREVKKVLMNDQAADRKPGWCGSAFMGSSGPSSPLSPSSSSIPSSIIRSFRESENKRWASFFIINIKKSTDLVHKKDVY